MTHEPGWVVVIPVRNEPERSADRSSTGDDRDTRHRAPAFRLDPNAQYAHPFYWHRLS